ncbi:cofactor-independent phosphoglycerate mutase [Geoalkalibacter sp.]|uniref:cofactor-independent phosphoglycerate mutase n=1 Tax=Geoalkalibacter sp. TaxID=3041440 RepID=UPI00272E68D2|nr:cofactor-independent phosphoglycerate mutase [Geoalkalibacter sp.]
MKYIILLGDGMADEPISELGGRTPLEAARTPNMDALARAGETGMVQTVPEGYHPGSDVANLTVFGYDPRTCYSGRSPLEAASMGIELGPADVAFRLNLVCLTPHYGKLYMEDFSAGHISTVEARELITMLEKELGGGPFEFHAGVSYRHLMVWRGGRDRMQFTPPHDLTGQSVENDLPRGDGAEELIHLMTSSQMLLKNHPVNVQREKQRQVPANSIWLWGHGKAPRMATLQERYNLSGAVVAAVDLIKGIGVYAGLDIIEVPGATGYLDTNYRGKAEYAVEALKTRDFVYLHVEAPDEAAHGGMLDEKIRAIENFDREVVGPVRAGLEALGPHRILLQPDHATPVRKKTHTSQPVPYVLFDSAGGKLPANGAAGYHESAALQTGMKVEEGWRLFDRLIRG